jgi:hypothetical protein
LLIACALFAAAYHKPAIGQKTTRQGEVDWIFVLDTSASMRGAGGTKDIFGKVLSALGDFIRSARPGDSVTIYTFDRDTNMHPTVHIADETDKRDLLSMLQGLQANGDRTHTGKAIHDALVRAGELKKRSEAAHRVGSIVLLTDGLEDVRGISNPITIPSNVTLVPNSQPYIFFVSLGQEHDQQIEDFVNDPALEGRGEVVRDPGAENIETLADRIREPIEEAAEAPAPSPTPVNITVEPSSLDFGQIEPGAYSTRQSINVRSNTATTVTLTLEGSNSGPIRLAEPSSPIALKANESVPVNVQLVATPDASDGARAFVLKAAPRSDVGDYSPDIVVKPALAEARVNVAHVALWRRLLKWLALFLIVLLIAVVLYSLYRGNTPWAIWGDLRNRKKLEGEIEMLRPMQHEEGPINLGRLNANSVTLSALVPDGVTADSDAELTTAYQNGVKRVQLHRTQGAVRVNHAEVAFTDLYDSDIIELGDARLRFNWLGHERPTESEEDLS